jgi:hypothetical protein
MAARAMTTIHQPALRRRRRRGLAGDEECDSGKSDVNGEKGGRRRDSDGDGDGDGDEGGG